jgi:hypothetical protein
MTRETQQPEYPYSVKIETPTGQSATVSIAFLTPKQVEDFLQFEFKRLAQEAGVKGARIHLERAATADYEKVISEATACLRTATVKVAVADLHNERDSNAKWFG